MTERISKRLPEPNAEAFAPREWTDGTPPIFSTLKEGRARIDDIDEQIRFLLGKRLNLTNDAARFKQDANEVPAPARQKEVLDKALSHAVELENLFPEGYLELVEATTKIIMSTCIGLQGKAMARTRLIT